MPITQGKRLFLLKNPWSHMRWKGRFSDRDLRSWTPEISETLHYNPRNAQQFDNGVFWIDYESILGVFDVFYLNWRPTLFQYTSCTHDMWHGGSGPAKDLYNIGDNPQYLLSVSSTGAAVWVLLTRHIVDRDDFASNKEYIALLVYKGGDKVYLPRKSISQLTLRTFKYLSCLLTYVNGWMSSSLYSTYTFMWLFLAFCEKTHSLKTEPYSVVGFAVSF